jgi:uncharacterized protein
MKPGMSWSADPLERRRAERDRRLALAREHVERLARRMPVRAAAVAGSVGRGDFNLWSDVDLVIVSEALPPPGQARVEMLAGGAPPGLEVHGYTTAEFARAFERGDRLALDAVDHGVVVSGASISDLRSDGT